MNKKLFSQVIIKNISLLILSIMPTMSFIRQVADCLYTPKGMGALNVNSAEYTLFQLKINITQGSYNHLYIINNYPLIPIAILIAYNAYILIKVYNNKADS